MSRWCMQCNIRWLVTVEYMVTYTQLVYKDKLRVLPLFTPDYSGLHQYRLPSIQDSDNTTGTFSPFSYPN